MLRYRPDSDLAGGVGRPVAGGDPGESVGERRAARLVGWRTVGTALAKESAAHHSKAAADQRVR